MSALTIVLLVLTCLVAVTALVIAWRLRRAQRRDEAVHGYGPPIVVFPKPSATSIQPAEQRRAPASAPRPVAAASFDGSAGHQHVPSPGGERSASPSSLPQRGWHVGGPGAAMGGGDGVGGAAAAASGGMRSGDGTMGPSDGLPLDAAARIREVERRLRDDMELPMRVEQEQPVEPPSRPIRRRSVQREVADGMGAQLGEVDGVLALAPHASPSANVHAMPPVGGTLQMLPGRLVIVEGEEAGRELRFVRLGSNPQSVTVGRNAGRPYEHVQLKAQTVSRLHAKLQYDDGRWSVENLSRTNPLVVNGRAVAAGAAPTALSEGDVIEVGEVLLRFHER